MRMRHSLRRSICFSLASLCVQTFSFAKDREVSVTGSCSRQVTTDRGAVIITADVLDQDLKTAVRKATQQYERTLSAVKKLGLADEDLRTVEYNVSEDKQWEKDRMVSKGFRARIGFRVTTSDIPRLGEVMEIAAREDIKNVGAMSTFLSDERIRKEQDLCLKDAANHAREKAEKLADTLGASLGPVITLSESNVTSPPPFRPIMARAMLKSADVEESAAPSIQSGRLGSLSHGSGDFRLQVIGSVGGWVELSERGRVRRWRLRRSL